MALALCLVHIISKFCIALHIYSLPRLLPDEVHPVYFAYSIPSVDPAKNIGGQTEWTTGQPLKVHEKCTMEVGIEISNWDGELDTFRLVFRAKPFFRLVELFRV